MNYIQHLNGFFDRIRHDPRLTASHVSLYIALFQYWNYNRFQGSFPIYREKIMQLCKIGSKNTYHKCIKDLHDIGYIRYQPPLTRFSPGKVTISRFDVANNTQLQPGLFDAPAENPTRTDAKKPPPAGPNFEPTGPKIDTNAGTDFEPTGPKNDTHTSTDFDTHRVPHLTVAGPNFDTGTVPNLGHSIKQNSKHRALTQGDIEKSNLGHGVNTYSSKEKKLPAKNSSLTIAWSAPAAQKVASPPEAESKTTQPPPAYPAVWAYFLHKKYPDVEAEKFFNHYQAVGWMIQGIAPIHDWKALADKWMLNAPRFNRPAAAAAVSAGSTTHIHLQNEKNYDEPL